MPFSFNSLTIRLWAPSNVLKRSFLRQPARAFVVTAASQKQPMPPRPQPPPEEEIEESYLKGSGPGGQKINKTNSAVQLKHTPTGIVVKSQATRSRTQNRKIARALLAERLDELYNGEESRSAIVGEIKRKKAASAAKKSKRKYKKLEEKPEGSETTSQDQPEVTNEAQEPEHSKTQGDGKA